MESQGDVSLAHFFLHLFIHKYLFYTLDRSLNNKEIEYIPASPTRV